MVYFLAYSRARDHKQKERAQTIASLPPIYHQALTASDVSILSTPISELVRNVQAGTWDPVDVLRSYGKKAIQAQKATNCLTEIMLSDAEDWAVNARRDGPLAGVPVSLKDTVVVKGHDACYGYAAFVGQPATSDSALVRLLRDAGAVPFVKTSIPITLLSAVSESGVFGVTTNPHSRTHTPGGSSGGEGALLAFGGSRVGIGTDVAGSVRIPAHYSGVYTIKASTGRCPRTGNRTSIPGQEAIPAVYSPMARTLEDLETFWKALVSMKPWEYDNSCLNLPWKDINLRGKKIRWGVMWHDGILPPSPACERALSITVEALKKSGHDVTSFNPPDTFEALKVGTQLIFSDGGETVMKPFLFMEPNDAGAKRIVKILRLPSIFRFIWCLYFRYIRRDPLTADIIAGLYKKTTTEHLALVTRREIYRAKFFEAWKNSGIDFLLTVPNPLPAIPVNGAADSLGSLVYTALFNLLDYTAGVLPVTKVSKVLDDITPDLKHKLRAVPFFARLAYRNYDAKAMDGLPVGVQIVGRRLEEEKVLQGMKIVEASLKAYGCEYKLMAI